MAVKPTPILPEKWCILADTFSGAYVPSRRYLGKNNNLEQETTVTLDWLFKDEVEQKEFFDWWVNEVDNGGDLFYAKLPLYADSKHYLFAQNAPLVQSVYPRYKISIGVILFLNKTMEDTMSPLTNDVSALIDENSSNNVIMLDIEDVDSTDFQIEFVGSHAGATINGQSVTYTPVTGFNGDVVFHYKAYDGLHWSNTSAINIKVIDVSVPVAFDIVMDIDDGGNDNMLRGVPLNGMDYEGRTLTYSLSGLSSGVTIPDDSVSLARVDISSHNTTYSFHYTVNNGVHTSNVATATLTLVAIADIKDLIQDYPTSFHIPSGCVTGDPIKAIANFTEEFDSKGNRLSYTVSHGTPGMGTFDVFVKNGYELEFKLEKVTFVGNPKLTVTISNGLTSINRDIYFQVDSLISSSAYSEVSSFNIHTPFDNVNREVIIPFNKLTNRHGAEQYKDFRDIYAGPVIEIEVVGNTYGASVATSIINNRLKLKIAQGVVLNSNDYISIRQSNCFGMNNTAHLHVYEG